MLETVHTLWDALWAIPHLKLYLTLAWLLYIVLLCGWIVLQKREPVATLTWVLSLALLPYLGYLIYFLLGPQKISRQRMRRLRSRQTWHHIRNSPSMMAAPNWPCWDRPTTGLPPSTRHLGAVSHRRRGHL